MIDWGSRTRAGSIEVVTRFRWYRVDGDGELRVSDGGNEREVRVTYERKRETGN